MKIERETVLKMAQLARLELSDLEAQNLTGDMERILTFIDKLSELDTSRIEPLIYMSSETNIMRADLVKPTITHEEALKNAPKRDSDFFRVAKVIS